MSRRRGPGRAATPSEADSRPASEAAATPPSGALVRADAQSGIGMSFTFFGTSLAANVVVLSSQRMALSMREARAHLWNLSLLADAPDLLIKPARLELLAGVREEGPQVGSAIEELALEAGRRAVSVSRVESSEDAARQIIAMAA